MQAHIRSTAAEASETAATKAPPGLPLGFFRSFPGELGSFPGKTGPFLGGTGLPQAAKTPQKRLPSVTAAKSSHPAPTLWSTAPPRYVTTKAAPGFTQNSIIRAACPSVTSPCPSSREAARAPEGYPPTQLSKMGAAQHAGSRNTYRAKKPSPRPKTAPAPERTTKLVRAKNGNREGASPVKQ